jgi:hypothetical protein
VSINTVDEPDNSDDRVRGVAVSAGLDGLAEFRERTKMGVVERIAFIASPPTDESAAAHIWSPAADCDT